MKKLFNISSFLLVLFLICSLSCATKTVAKLPTISNAQYKSYTINDERGYDVNFQISDASAEPVGIIINRIQQTISPENREGLHYHVNVIAQSRKIAGFKAQGSKRPDGIIFKVGDMYYVKEVLFQSR